MRKEFKKEIGITLIALVITIIVLLILAGVAIIMLTGENGIISQAQRAKKETSESADIEDEKIREMESLVTGEAIKVKDSTPGELAGEGTSELPFKIESVEDLVAFLNAIRDGDNFENDIIELQYTLDLASKNSYANPDSTIFGEYNGDGNETGIFEELNNKDFSGLKLGNDIFKGTFDGKDNEIRNIYSNFNNQKYELGFIGVNKGTIKNLKISGEYKSSNLEEYYILGTICGLNQGDIINCVNNVKINIEQGNTEQIAYNMKIGAIAGVNQKLIENCINNGEININMPDVAQKIEQTRTYIGGITGQCEGENSIVNKCNNHGKLEVILGVNLEVDGYSKLNEIGGLVGSNDGKIMNSTNFAEVYFKDIRLGYANTANINIGGISAINSNSFSFAQTSNVINYGDITGISDDKIIMGGITGTNDSNYPKIQNVYNKGVVKGKAIDDGLRIGGIVGSGESVIYRAYNTGNVVSDSETRYIGGIIGDIYDETLVSESKYLSSTASAAAQGEEVNGIDRMDTLTASEIKELLNEGVRKLNETTNEFIEWSNVQ